MDKNAQYSELLDSLICIAKSENRFLEFKANYLDAQRLGKYISALSNGACLDRQDFAYLFFGVEDGTMKVTGTAFNPSSEKAAGNQSLEIFLRQYTEPRINFTIEEFLYRGEKRIVMFKIPAAVSEPVHFMRKAYVRVDSHTTELAPYADWTREIYTSSTDWTAQIVEDATIDDLDPEAVFLARNGYKQRYPDYAAESDRWTDEVFLSKANLLKDGRVTRATMLLLGREEKSHLLDHIAQMVWKCHQDGETFGDIYTIPYVKTTSKLLSRIRNYRFKIYPRDSLIPAEVWKYDAESILEGLHNCIAHQDYRRNERIVVTEKSDKLTFENAGGFYDGNYEEYILGEKTPRRYRNPFLVKAMVNIKMIDTQGYGIHKLFLKQKERFLPMPDYDGSRTDSVAMHLPGTVIDERYSLMLLQKHDLTLYETVMLDNVQKQKPISAEAFAVLKKKRLVEGRRPSIYIAKQLAHTVDRKVEYSRHKGLQERECTALLIGALKDHQSLKKREVVLLLKNVLSDQLTDKQKEDKIDNLLRKMKKSGIITNVSRGNQSVWLLVK